MIPPTVALGQLLFHVEGEELWVEKVGLESHYLMGFFEFFLT